ncbi:YVTN family beta-propeller protein [Motilibacter rhizosphaerae]|uniref:YVTN family beta-propeller protein n=1 Tax=Motilibacter rhizosphaerae TaxID=598652 RepID=A0A4Q7NWL7_9ACTN|nr:YncE family protein [Motilibacter rhizosphaerae]RZS91308.1 YVTN family beta-propeller protein [Motilibacter rhizosphaerae]
MLRLPARSTALAGVGLALLAGCTSGSTPSSSGAAASSGSGSAMSGAASASAAAPSPSRAAVKTASATGLLPGMPPPLSPGDVWAADRPGALVPATKGIKPLVYVPNSKSDTVTVIDPATGKVLRTVKVGHEPQHVVPSWDLKTLWVNNDLGNSLTPIDARTGKFGKRVAVADPYNLYFTPDGKYAVVMASMLHRLDFRDPHTMKLEKSVHVPCAGVNHADFSADGRYFLVSCEFSGQMLKVDTAKLKLVSVLRLPHRAGKMAPKPQDVKAAPNGKTFYVADMMSDGMWVIDGPSFKVTGFIPTGRGAHGLYVTRDSKDLLVTNRDEGSISEYAFAGMKLLHKWKLPGGGSPDMGGLSVDGTQFWVSGRYNGVVYAVDIRTGKLLHKIKVGAGPHGLCFWPQPGRYSLGHTGVMR